MKSVYLAAAIAGTLIPWAFFAGFLAEYGVDLPLFLTQLVATKPAAGFTADLLITCAIFWIWSYRDSKTHGIAGWWMTIPAIWLVGLSLGLPLYLWLREQAFEKRASPAAG